MNTYDSFKNPFSDPFEDSSVLEAAQTKELEADDSYNPFSNQQNGARNNSIVNLSNNATPSASELQKRQEELDKRADELRQREEALRGGASISETRFNFPPLPGFCPIRSCFYQDIEAEIPVQFQRLVTFIFYFWAGYSVLLLWNVIMCLTYFVVTMGTGLRNHSAVNLTLALLNLIIFCPASYVCWFRPAYKAFKFDSSINFFIFFFVFFMQFVTSVLQCIAIDGWGFAGILNSMEMFSSGSSSAVIVAAFMFVTGVAFGIAAAITLFLLFKVHQVYHNTGGSLAKAHMELTNDVESNRVMRETTGNVAESGAHQALLGTRK